MTKDKVTKDLLSAFSMHFLFELVHMGVFTSFDPKAFNLDVTPFTSEDTIRRMTNTKLFELSGELAAKFMSAYDLVEPVKEESDRFANIDVA